MSQTKNCHHCGAEFPMSQRGRPPRYCSKACKQAAYHLRRAIPPRRGRIHRESDSWCPPSLHFADLALRRGYALAKLDLSDDERAVLVAASDRFSWEQRIRAARHLAEIYSWASTGESERDPRASDDIPSDLEMAIISALLDAWKPCSVWSVRGSGIRWRRAHWTPARWPWGQTLHAYLPYWLRANHVRPREEDALQRADVCIGQPVGDEVRALGEIVPGGTVPSAVGVSGFRRPPHGLRGCSSTGDPIPASDMKKIRRQILETGVATRDPDEGGSECKTRKRSRGSFVSSASSISSSTSSWSETPATSR
jgi:hypothetical protein